MNAKTVLKYASDQVAKFLSVRFTDLPGSWQHLTFPIAELGEETFEDGFGFDASSIRGWAAIHESDMLLVPEASRYWLDPFAEQPTLCLIGNAVDPSTKEGYVPCPPTDSLSDLRSEISLTLGKCGVTVECHHHEVATAGQCEIDFRFSTLLGTADNLQIFKYVVRNTAYQYGKAATFMPKPLFGDNGSGMHCHQSLWKSEKPLFAGDGYAGLSEMARFYIGGLLKHAAAVVAFAAPTTNSYKRLVPGFEAPVNLAYSARNRSAAIRIPMFSTNPKLKRLEFRPPDPSCNAYLAFSAMLLAGIDGIQNRIMIFF